MVPSVREELVGPVHTTSTVTPSTASSSKVMEQVRLRLEPVKVEDGGEATITEEGGRTRSVKQRKVRNK